MFLTVLFKIVPLCASKRVGWPRAIKTNIDVKEETEIDIEKLLVRTAFARLTWTNPGWKGYWRWTFIWYNFIFWEQFALLDELIRYCFCKQNHDKQLIWRKTNLIRQSELWWLTLIRLFYILSWMFWLNVRFFIWPIEFALDLLVVNLFLLLFQNRYPLDALRSVPRRRVFMGCSILSKWIFIRLAYLSRMLGLQFTTEGG